MRLPIKSNSPKTDSHNSFWSRDFDIDYDKYSVGNVMSSAEIETLKKYRLASARKAIANFVTITTGKQIPVRFSVKKQSYTDGESVVLSGDIDDKENFDIGVGLALHEGSHILLTDFGLLRNAGYIGKRLSIIPDYIYDKAIAKGINEYKVTTIVKDILNVVEDRRIDSYIYKNAPGYREYYKKLYDKYFAAKVISDALKSSNWRSEDVNSYMGRIINFMNPDSDLTSLKGLRKIWNILDVHNIDRLKSTSDALTVALNIFEVIVDSIDDMTAPPKPKKQPKQKSAPKTKSQKSESDDIEGDTGEGESNSDDEIETQNSDGEQSDSDSDDSNESDSTHDKLGNKGSSDEESDEDDSEQSAGNYEDESDEDETDGGEPQNSEGEETDEDETDESENSDGEESDDESEDETDESENGDGESDDDGGFEYEDLSANKQKQLEKILKAQRDFLNNEVKKKQITQELDKDLKQVEASNSEVKHVADELNLPGIKNGADVVVYKKLTIEMLDNRTVPLGKTYSWKSPKHPTYELYSCLSEEEMMKAEQMGGMLGKKLQVRGEARTTVYNRQRNGKLDGRLIASLGYDNESVFNQKFVDQYKKANVHLSLDASSSMSGTKWTQTIINALALGKAVSMIENLSMQISVRFSRDLPEIAMVWDSRTESYAKLKSLLPYIHPDGCTPEGLCFEAIAKMMIPSNATMDSYFVNISDGEPWYSNGKLGITYGYDTALIHTKREMDKIRNSGIGVLSYFISDRNSSSDGFDKMYGTSARYIDINSINEVTNTLNKMFMSK
jgi:hypothetical protein